MEKQKMKDLKEKIKEKEKIMKTEKHNKETKGKEKVYKEKKEKKKHKDKEKTYKEQKGKSSDAHEEEQPEMGYPKGKAFGKWHSEGW